MGRYTSAVAKCTNNSKRDTHLSWCSFPDGKDERKQKLCKKWINLISCKDFRPSKYHRVCSEHFVGGKKTYLNNLPLIVPKATRPVIPTPRPIVKSINRDRNITLKQKENRPIQIVKTDVEWENTEQEEIKMLKEEMQAMKDRHKEEIEGLKNEMEDLR